MTGRAFVTAVLQELGAVGVGETPEASIADVVLGQWNRLIDNWNADREAIYADQFLTFTLTPNLQPHTIGPTGATWAASQRPVSIEGATLIVGTINYPMNVRTASWWQDQPQPTLSTDLPTDLYYDPTWPNGSLYFWPVPTANYQVQIQTRGILSAFTLDTVISAPPGYLDAMILTTAEASQSALAAPDDPRLAMRAAKARARIFANNIVTPPLATRDSGVPGARGWFNWRSGMVE